MKKKVKKNKKRQHNNLMPRPLVSGNELFAVPAPPAEDPQALPDITQHHDFPGTKILENAKQLMTESYYKDFYDSVGDILQRAHFDLFEYNLLDDGYLGPYEKLVGTIDGKPFEFGLDFEKLGARGIDGEDFFKTDYKGDESIRADVKKLLWCGEFHDWFAWTLDNSVPDRVNAILQYTAAMKAGAQPI